MTRSKLPTALTLLTAAATAAAHTGHGHEGMGHWEGLLHAASEPDHLLMLAVGAMVCTVAAPRVLRAAARLRRRLLDRIAAQRARPGREPQP